MTKAIDPFEEFLRKKKVEMLEQRFRGEGAPSHAGQAAPEEAPRTVAEAKPDAEARLSEEMDEFFETGQNAGAQFFSKVDSGIPEEKVEEIRDALDDVFEEDAPTPQTEETDETFVHFFREVQEKYDEDGEKPAKVARETDKAAPRSVARAAEAPLDVLSAEIVDAADVIEPSAPEAVAGAFDAIEELAEEEARSAGAGASSRSRLNLAEILGAPVNEKSSAQRVDLLSRLVVKLAERVGLPENEIIEVLIKSKVEF